MDLKSCRVCRVAQGAPPHHICALQCRIDFNAVLKGDFAAQGDGYSPGTRVGNGVYL